MKRSAEPARLITADNPEWTSAELPASHHPVIGRMCPQKVPRQHCRSPAPRATCLLLSLWGLLKPFFRPGLVMSSGAIYSAAHLWQSWDTQGWDAEPICWLFPFTSAWKDDHKGFYRIAQFLMRRLDNPAMLRFDLMLFLNTAGGKHRLQHPWLDPFQWVVVSGSLQQEFTTKSGFLVCLLW